MEEWGEGSTERHLLESFRDMAERVQERINQLRQTKEQLIEREEQYRSIFEASTDALMIGDLEEGSVVEANPAACQMYGYTYDEFIGLRPNDITPLDYQHLPGEARSTIKEGGQFQAQGAMALRKDGTTFYVDAHTTPFTYKGKLHQLAAVRDVTERIEVEQQLREKEAQYRGVFEATDDGLVIQDLNGLFIEVNPAFCHMLGYTHEELIGLHYSQVTYPDYYTVVEENTQQVQAEGRAQAQGYAKRKDGSSLPVEAHSTSFTYKSKPHMLGVMRDITERVEAEQQLREKEAQYRGIFEATSDGLIIADLHGVIVEANPAACRIYGYAYEELLGLSPTALTHPDSLAQVAKDIRTIQGGNQVQTRPIGLRKDGSSFYAEVHGTPFTYRGRPHALAIVRDVTAQVQAEQQLREKEEQYRSIFEATSDGLIIRNMHGAVVQVNPAACKMHGYSYEEYLALSRDTLIHPDHLPQLREIIQTVKAGRTFQGQAVDLRKDGSTFPVESRIDPFTFLGQPHMLTVLHDITERVEAERQLREREEQYRSVFEATYDALVVMDLDGYFVEVNPAFCRMFGYTREGLLGKHGSLTTAPDTLPILDDFLQVVNAGRNYQVPKGTQGVRKDGTLFYAESHTATLTYQGKSHVLGVIRDITEQVQARQLLEQRVEERTRELGTLLEISHMVASTLQLKPLLGLILDQLKTVVGYTGSGIFTLEGEDLVLLATRGPEPEEHLLQRHFSTKQMKPIWEVISRGEAVIIDNVRSDTPLAQAYREVVGELLETTLEYTRGWTAVPLMLKERVIGMLSLAHSQPNFYTPRYAELALAIANQAAIAIENARLYAQAQELAAVEERQRLARELHDSVSQALYGISLGVHTAQLQLDRNPKELAESLEYVLELAEAALMEMRALIFELRPESLEIEGLVTALTKQAAALQARQHIKVNTELCPEPHLPLKVKQELYRIAQEALHNTVKHAHASRIDLRMRQTSEAVTLHVCDDGRGFDAAASFPGHLGLHSMQERVTSLGGELQIESSPDQGTCIRVRVPARDAM
jgi:PAS domain S-box-containing protein